MEAPGGVASVRGVSLPMQSSRKEWRAVPEQNSGNEDLQRSKLGQSDERLIFEVQQPVDVDFCSITIDGSMDNELQQRLRSVVKQKEELQHIETELRAELIARSQIIALQSTYDSQIKEHVNANVKLQEQLREMEQSIHELEREIEVKERELHAVRLDTQAVWAKDDLLREQNKELANFRRERDNSEAERAQHLKQIHDFQEHIQEKERQLMELQEQHRAAQETVIFKDEQLREAQTWITRAQEMDALQTSTNQTLQAELRERIEQYNQLWMNCQRQFTELVHTIQALQIELAELRERSGTYSDESRASQSNLKDASQSGNCNGSQLDTSGNAQARDSSTLPNGNLENDSSMSQGNASGLAGQTNHVAAVPMVPQSLVRMPTYLPGQVAALHPYVMHQQAVPPSVSSHVPQSHTAHFQSVPAISSLQHWQNQQAALEEPHAVVPTLNEGAQVLESIDKRYIIDPQSQNNLQQLSSQFQEGLTLDSLKHNSEREKNINTLGTLEAHVSMTEQLNAKISQEPVTKNMFLENDGANVTLPSEDPVSTEEKSKLVGKSSEITLLDEGSLLRCIVRTIPPNGRIRISSTLPNRLGKMLSPLHWHDYKKSYGKLDDFVGGHPELFVIEGDFIQLKEGAQEIIAATAAFAKVKAAASATSSHSSLLPSVAVTPMAQPHRLRREHASSRPGNLTDNHSHAQLMNGVSYAGGAVSTVKILSKSKDTAELSSTEMRSQLPMQFTSGNGATIDRSDVVGSQIRGSVRGRANSNFVVKQQDRTSGTSSNPRR
ncbi:Kinesin-1 heavy chain [Heracleum sosnowskyi]|uniref:Kinesin-1 heavy chain n=1 Tax=Heracleum sosnowskyi TaxID=360622 RepID=A0AAD8HHN2_9APIA|nr:Kinesin-1 heavy chain [Heracleum sosnowskyi]